MRAASKGRAALALAACALAAAGALLGAQKGLESRACDVPPDRSAEAQEKDADGFAAVDWDYWRSVNPDVVGWVTVPGTGIDQPIVQASGSDPERYLAHDVYGGWNYLGCPYLDAGCAEGGLLGSRNAVVFGHNIRYGDGGMFAPLSGYVDPAFAAEHREILLQTPAGRRRLSVIAAEYIPGSEQSKRTEFSDERDYRSYVEGRLGGCRVRFVEDAEGIEQIWTFATCSYNEWPDDERTLVYAADLGGSGETTGDRAEAGGEPR